MSTIRQKRKSCEACRARKLKCSGQETGCWRCVRLGIVCKFQEKGLAGRPRKWSLNDAGEPQGHWPMQIDEQDKQSDASDDQRNDRDTLVQQDAEISLSHPNSSTVSPGESLVAASGSTDLLSSLNQGWGAGEGDETTFRYDGLEPLPLLDFETSAQLDALPLDSFGTCLIPTTHNGDTVSFPNDVPEVPTRPPGPCHCSKEVFGILQTLERTHTSHGSVHILRQGAELAEQLLTCPICYDVSNPPRMTLQNVILLGRLCLEVTTGYHRYLDWAKEHCAGLAEKQKSDVVYLNTGVDDENSALGFEISGERFYELIAHGLQTDVKILSDMGSRFATRQLNRHRIGHEACPNWNGQCWKETQDINPDPLDMCPLSPAARTLTPCYRIVDEVRAKIKQFEDAIG